jgi:hypothetical protein
MRTAFFHGLTAGALAALASFIYGNVYSEALAVDYSVVVKPLGTLGSCVLGCMLASVGYHVFRTWVKHSTDAWFNALFTMLTFVTFATVFAVTLPLIVEAPELFIGFAIPMHVFPQLFWAVVKPLFSYPAV